MERAVAESQSRILAAAGRGRGEDAMVADAGRGQGEARHRR